MSIDDIERGGDKVPHVTSTGNIAQTKLEQSLLNPGEVTGEPNTVDTPLDGFNHRVAEVFAVETVEASTEGVFRDNILSDTTEAAEQVDGFAGALMVFKGVVNHLVNLGVNNVLESLNGLAREHGGKNIATLASNGRIGVTKGRIITTGNLVEGKILVPLGSRVVNVVVGASRSKVEFGRSGSNDGAVFLVQNSQLVQETAIVPDVIVGTVIIGVASQEGTGEFSKGIAVVLDDALCDVKERAKT